jgi:hypothetical protein|tara:strand:- start:39 stop:230 length:192 start_codon:yes stop_codon:yes gene_type:complete
MASEFQDLCDSYGLSASDPEAIDKLIMIMNSNGEEMDDDDIKFYAEQGFIIDESLLPDDYQPD